MNEETDKIPEFSNLSEINDFLKKRRTSKRRLSILLLISSHNNQKKIIREFLKDNYEVISLSDTNPSVEFNDFYKIKKLNPKWSDLPFVGYLYFFSENPSSFIFLSFSDSSTIKRYLFTHFLNKNSNVNTLWINHRITLDLFYHLRKKYRVFLDFVKGNYSPCSGKQSMIRPSFNRVITYRGDDVIQSFPELNKDYGIDLEEFEGRLKGDDFKFRRNNARFTLRYGHLNSFLKVSKWLFKESDLYMKEIRDFKKQLHQTFNLKREFKTSNNLKIEFDELLPINVLNLLIEEIKKIENIELLYIHPEDVDSERINLQFINKEKRGIFQLSITPKSINFTQVLDNNFVGIFPVLDIIDYAQPKNNITLIA